MTKDDYAPALGSGRSHLLMMLAAAIVPIGLSLMIASEATFFSKHGLVTNERTALRLARMAFDGAGRLCTLERRQAATLEGDVWTVIAEQRNGRGLCRVQIARKDGQLLRLETQLSAT